MAKPAKFLGIEYLCPETGRGTILQAKNCNLEHEKYIENDYPVVESTYLVFKCPLCKKKHRIVLSNA